MRWLTGCQQKKSVFTASQYQLGVLRSPGDKNSKRRTNIETWENRISLLKRERPSTSRPIGWHTTSQRRPLRRTGSFLLQPGRVERTKSVHDGGGAPFRNNCTSMQLAPGASARTSRVSTERMVKPGCRSTQFTLTHLTCFSRFSAGQMATTHLREESAATQTCTPDRWANVELNPEY